MSEKTGRYPWGTEPIEISKNNIKRLFDEEKYDILYEAYVTSSELADEIIDTLGSENCKMIAEKHFSNLK